MEIDATVVEQIRGVCATVFNMPIAEVPATASPEDLPMWDSLYHFTLIAALEDHFSITYTSDEIPEMSSIPAIARATIRHTQQPLTR